MFLREKLEEARRKELKMVVEEGKREEIFFLEEQKLQREKMDESLKIERIAKENFLPILEVVKEAYLKKSGISFNTGDNFSIINMNWDFVDASGNIPGETLTYWNEFSIKITKDLSFKLYGSRCRCFFESSLNDKNWKNKLEDAIFSLLTSHPKMCFDSFSHTDTGP